MSKYMISKTVPILNEESGRAMKYVLIYSFRSICGLFLFIYLIEKQDVKNYIVILHGFCCGSFLHLNTK